jgi:hypothetical protein
MVEDAFGKEEEMSIVTSSTARGKSIPLFHPPLVDGASFCFAEEPRSRLLIGKPIA